MPLPLFISAFFALPGLFGCGSLRLWFQSYTRPARFVEPDRYRLFGIAGAVFSLADLIHFGMYELAGLRAGGFTFGLIAFGLVDSFFIWHKIVF